MRGTRNRARASSSTSASCGQRSIRQRRGSGSHIGLFRERTISTAPPQKPRRARWPVGRAVIARCDTNARIGVGCITVCRKSEGVLSLGPLDANCGGSSSINAGNRRHCLRFRPPVGRLVRRVRPGRRLAAPAVGAVFAGCSGLPTACNCDVSPLPRPACRCASHTAREGALATAGRVRPCRTRGQQAAPRTGRKASYPCGVHLRARGRPKSSIFFISVRRAMRSRRAACSMLPPVAASAARIVAAST
jgi:hypothetical protein